MFENHDDQQFAARMMRELTLVEAPASIWTSIEEALSSEASSVSSGGRLETGWPRMLALAAIAILAIGGVVFWSINRIAPYDVVRVDASSGVDRVSIGEWIETGAQAKAAIELIEGQGGVVAGVAAVNIDVNEGTRPLITKYNCQSALRAEDSLPLPGIFPTGEGPGTSAK